MKTTLFGSWKSMLVLAALPFFIAGIFTRLQTSVTADEPASNNSPGLSLAQPNPDAPAPVVATPAPPDVRLSAGAAEVARLAQSGVSDDVMLAFVANAVSRFNLGSDQIIYLNDLGVSGDVVKGMIQRDAALNDAATQAAAAPPNAPPPDNNSYPPPPPVDDSTTANPGNNPDYTNFDPANSPPLQDDSGYFYNSLSPYGTWIFVNGYGRCWQPTVCVMNHDWRPYCDRGRWLNTDCGWYWHSDYSWGWAAFHYGRWFCDAHRGWVWCPEHVWGPAWVSWRQSGEYCGWAPLPPSARFAPGIGFKYGNHAVGAGFEFGLHSNHYNFIPIERMTDYAPSRYALSGDDVTRVYHQTVVNNHGIDPAQVAAASRIEIRKAVIREMPGNGSGVARPDHLEKSGNTLMVFRPQLPKPGVNKIVPSRPKGSGISGSISPYSQPFSAPVPAINIARTMPASTLADSSPKAGTYPPNSLILIGRKDVNNSRPLPNMNLGNHPTQPSFASYESPQNAAAAYPMNYGNGPRSYAASSQPPATPWLNRTTTPTPRVEPEPAQAYGISAFAAPAYPAPSIPRSYPQQNFNNYNNYNQGQSSPAPQYQHSEPANAPVSPSPPAESHAAAQQQQSALAHVSQSSSSSSSWSSSSRGR